MEERDNNTDQQISKRMNTKHAEEKKEKEGKRKRILEKIKK